MNKRNFKSIFLYQTFQKKIISFILIINSITILLFYLGVLHFFNIFTQKGLQIGIPKGHIFYRFIAQLKGEMDLIIVFIALFSFLCMLIGSYIISHKISGPLYRLRLEISRMNQNGQLHPLKFRKGDYILDLEKEFNELEEKINSH